MRSEDLGFRRRCAWCAVALRGWQLNLCRLCKRAVRLDAPGPPCGQLSRADSDPDS